MYQNGEGVPVDYEKALNHFRVAADQGFPAAQYALGITLQYFCVYLFFTGSMYLRGLGIPVDYNKAKENLLLAAEQKNIDALFLVGMH